MHSCNEIVSAEPAEIDMTSSSTMKCDIYVLLGTMMSTVPFSEAGGRTSYHNIAPKPAHTVDRRSAPS
jgi:hypothetical protein